MELVGAVKRKDDTSLYSVNSLKELVGYCEDAVNRNGANGGLSSLVKDMFVKAKAELERIETLKNTNLMHYATAEGMKDGYEFYQRLGGLLKMEEWLFAHHKDAVIESVILTNETPLTIEIEKHNVLLVGYCDRRYDERIAKLKAENPNISNQDASRLAQTITISKEKYNNIVSIRDFRRMIDAGFITVTMRYKKFD